MMRIRLRLGTLTLLILVAALVTVLIVQGRRIAELEAVAGPISKTRRMVAEKRSAEIAIERQAERANVLKIREGNDR
jgi:hypothetical protein